MSLTAQRFCSALEPIKKLLFIGGEWTSGVGDAKFAVSDPATTDKLCVVVDACAADSRMALDAAVGAQADWARAAPRLRSDILLRACEIMTERIDELAMLVTLEMGKSLTESRAEVLYAADFFRWFGGEAVRVGGDFAKTPDGLTRSMVLRQPVGPCLLITPWNFPLAMGTRKIGPAVAAGCTMVLKPAHQTPLSSLALASILGEAGLPPGVLNVVTTTDPEGACAPLLESGAIRKLSFTGSTRVGRHLLSLCGSGVVRPSLELGGNAPFIVLSDADLAVAIECAVQAKMRNAGQACTAANRFFVPRSLTLTFASQLAEKMGELTVGPGYDPGSEVGPLVDAQSLHKVGHLVDDAVERGATVVRGGRPLERPGYFYEPTVLTEVSPASELVSTEIFGPVAAIQSFDPDDDVVNLANSTEWGLVAYLFTQNLDRALEVSERLEVGMVGLNTGMVSNPAVPFGGVKASGLGREGGRVGIDEFLEYKLVAMPVRKAATRREASAQVPLQATEPPFTQAKAGD